MSQPPMKHGYFTRLLNSNPQRYSSSPNQSNPSTPSSQNSNCSSQPYPPFGTQMTPDQAYQQQLAYHQLQQQGRFQNFANPRNTPPQYFPPRPSQQQYFSSQSSQPQFKVPQAKDPRDGRRKLKKASKQPVVHLDEDDDDDVKAKRSITRWNRDEEILLTCMRTRNSNFPNNSPVTISRHRNRRRVPNVVEPELRTIVEVAPMAERTMKELLRAPTEGYGEAIVITEINADHFEFKTNLDVPNDVIKLMMFPYSLEGNARIWYEKEPPNSILTWEDLVTKFVNQFFPPSKTTHLKNEISRCTQKFDETFSEACLNDNDQDSLNAAAGGNLLSKTTREALNIIENKSKVRYSRNKSNVSRVNSTSRESFSKTDERIDKLADQILTLVKIVSKKVVTPVPVKAVEEICVTCNGPHAWYNCPNTDSNQSSICAVTGTYNQVNPPNRVSNQMAPPGFAPVQNNGQNSTAHIPPPVTPIPILEPNVPKTLPMPNIPYPSRCNDQKSREKASNQMEKIFQILLAVLLLK
ncbi:reverse transcriptase domain-containing protein [Tanacetum coccineum]